MGEDTIQCRRCGADFDGYIIEDFWGDDITDKLLQHGLECHTDLLYSFIKGMFKPLT